MAHFSCSYMFSITVLSDPRTCWRMRKIKRKFRIPTPFTLHLDVPAMLFHDPVTDAKTETHSVAHVFCRKKRIENLVEMFRCDSFAVIPHDNHIVTILPETSNPNSRHSFRAGFPFQCKKRILQ